MLTTKQFPVKKMALLGAAFTIIYIGCKKGEENYTGRLTILNTSPNTSSFSVAFADNIVDSTTPYGEPQYDHIIPAVTSTMAWRRNTSLDYDSSFVTDIPNGEDFTLIFYDSSAKYKTYMVKDYWKQEASDTKGYVRFFPLVSGATQIRVTNDTNKVLIASVTYGAVPPATTAFASLDTFQTKLRLYNGTTLLDSVPGARLEGGKSYTYYAVGVLGGTGDKRPRLIIHQHE